MMIEGSWSGRLRKINFIDMGVLGIVILGGLGISYSCFMYEVIEGGVLCIKGIMN
jgi:hypothetical protein